MSQYLNNISLIKYNNTTYQKVGQQQTYSIREPLLVSSDPRIDYFNYPWKTDNHWLYNNFGAGWNYNGKDEITYTLNKQNSELSCFNPFNHTFIESGFVYNTIPIHPKLLEDMGPLSSDLFNNLEQKYILSATDGLIYKIKYDINYKASYPYQETIDGPVKTAHTYEVIGENGTTVPLVLDWSPENIDGNYHETPYVTGYWDNSKVICGILYSYPFLKQGSVDDIYSNEIHFNLESPNLECITVQTSISSNLTKGVFTNIPGTNYITGICMTKMHFIDDQYVYMRGLVQGNIEVQSGVIQNEVISPSTIIRKVNINNLHGTLKNISKLPEKVKYGLNHYYAWGWLYGIDNIQYSNIWYKNEISGVLKTDKENNFTGILSTFVTTNNGTEDIYNIISGMFRKSEQSNIISGYMQGNIEPFNINMKGLVIGYYSYYNNVLKPMQLSGVLYNKSVINKELRQILDIKYYNTLGRKGLAQLHSLYGENLNFASKNYDPFNKPYMLQSWKIIEYKLSDQQQLNVSKQNSVDLNTYLASKNYIQKYKSKIQKTDEELNALVSNGSDRYYVLWESDQKTNNFVIKCISNSINYDPQSSNDIPSNCIKFNTSINAQTYIKHICAQSNLKIKQYKISDDGIITSYILDSSDLEIK